MHRRRAAQRQRITRINDDIDQRQTVARRNAVLAQRQRLAPAHQPQHADKRQRHPQPLQRMRPPAQKNYIHQQHRERNQRGNHRHIDHTRATGKSAIQHHIEQRKTAAADDEQPPRPRLQLWPVGANLAVEQQRKQRRCQQPAPKRERIRRQPRLAELAGNTAGRPKKRREKKHHIRMRQTVGLEKFHGIRKK